MSQELMGPGERAAWANGFERCKQRLVVTPNTLYYLRSIHRQMKEFHAILPDSAVLSIGAEVLADNLEWLNCYCDTLERNFK